MVVSISSGHTVGLTTSTLSNIPSSRRRRVVSSRRTGAIGCSGPKLYARNPSSQITRAVEAMAARYSGTASLTP